MATAVYSTRFIAVAGLDGAASHTCPVGFVVVLRDLDVYYSNLEPGSVEMIGSESQVIWQNTMSGADVQSYASWRGRQVFIEGESVSIVTEHPTDVTLSGYLLTAP